MDILSEGNTPYSLKDLEIDGNDFLKLGIEKNQYFKEIFNQDMKNVTFKKRLYVYKHYILFSVLTGQKHPIKNVKGILNKIMVAVLYIPGKIMTNIKLKK